MTKRRMRWLTFALVTAALVVGALAYVEPASAVPRRTSETALSGNLAVQIPAFGQAQHVISFRGGGPILAVSVSVRLTHPNVRALETRLVGPNGSVAATLTSGAGPFGPEPDLGAGAADCSGTPARFADGGAQFEFAAPPFIGTYAPEDGFAELSDVDSFGSWRLVLVNDGSDVGSLHCWSVTVVRRAEVAQASGHRAELSYFASEDEAGFPEYSSVRLRITRGGSEVFNRLQRGCGRFCDVWPSGATRGSSIRFRQLDRDPAPELLFDYFTGGASCCEVSRMYDDRAGYRETERNWTRVGYRLIRPPRSKALVFQSGDGDFICALAACAFSPAPIQLLSFRAGRLVDVTRSYRSLVRRDLGKQWRALQQLKRRNFEITGALAAWLADKHLLGESRQGWRVVRGFVTRGEVARYGGYVGKIPYLEALSRLLRRSGYMR